MNNPTLGSSTLQSSFLRLQRAFTPRHGRKIKKHESTTKYKKHRADKGLREFSALNKLPARLPEGYSECPTFFYTEPLCGIQEKAKAQTAHLVFADTKANAEKTKRAVFCQR